MKTCVINKVEIEQKVSNICSTILNQVDLDLGKSFFEYGITSVEITQLKMKLQSEFNIEIDNITLFNFKNIWDVIEYIYKSLVKNLNN